MRKFALIAIVLIIGIGACREVAPIDSGRSLEHIPYLPTSYTVNPPPGFPAMEIPADNPMTTEGVELGRHLFYDPILSRDSTISCSSCHHLKKAFTDGRPVALGIEGRMGSRGAMSLINIGYSWIKSRPYNFMWDGRFATLEEQALEPIENPLEMDETWENVEQKLRRHPTYPTMFRKAFGISNTDEITRYLAARAIVQFERTLNSAGSRFDSTVHVAFHPGLNTMEKHGFNLFNGHSANNPTGKEAECGHCHSPLESYPLFASNDFSNNGLDSVQTFEDFVDKGFGKTVNNITRNGQFREVTVRNVALTAPYMHNGRFQTIRDVINHYTTGGHASPNLSPFLSTSDSLTYLTEYDKDCLEAFLHTLTDTSYYHKTEWMSPF